MNSQDSSQPGVEGSHHLPYYNILYDKPQGLHPNAILSQVEIPGILEGHNFLCRPLIKVRSKKSYNFRWELFNDMWHATYTQVNQGDTWLLVVRSQIGSLIPGPSFGHKLFFKHSNGSCEPILDIYVFRAFQWYRFFLVKWILTPEIAFWKFKSPLRL
jgi:hypothetical protein